PAAGGAVWVAFGSLALGLIAAVIGGIIGVTREQRLAAEQLAVDTPVGTYGYSGARPVLAAEQQHTARAGEGRQGIPPGVPLPVGTTASEEARRAGQAVRGEGRIEQRVGPEQ